MAADYWPEVTPEGTKWFVKGSREHKAFLQAQVSEEYNPHGNERKPQRNPRETLETVKQSSVVERETGVKQSENTVKQSVEELEAAAAPVLATEDPLVRLEESIRAIGFGGRTKHVLTLYLAATSRVLAMERGNMPVHTGVRGTTSAGKTYTLETTLDHLPESAFQKVDAGSPRILIYDKTDLRHKVIVFSEADSIPGIRQRGDDDDFNPAGAAFRALLQDHHLAYDYVDTKAQGGPKVVHIIREGPSVLLTTYTKRLPAQIDSRLFTFDMPEDMAQIRAALYAQGQAEVTGRGKPDEALIAYQALLQAKAPWRVRVPFAPRLAELIADRPSAPRIMRDFQRLLSLTKSVAILRYSHRLVDPRGYLLAQIADYQTVWDLVGDMYETTAGVSPDVRQAVEVVKGLEAAGQKGITATKVSEKLGVGKATAARWLGEALREGWLVNNNPPGKGRHWDLQIGEPMPDHMTLPSPDSLESVSECFATVSRESPEQMSVECFTVSTVLGDSVDEVAEV